MEESKEVRQIPIEDIIPNRFQPRLNFDEKALNELSESIKQHGIIQPLVLRPLGDKFEIIAGERRYKAATLAGLSKVPAIVTDMDDNTSAEVALVENIQRKDLSAIEEAKSYKTMLDRSGMTQEELAKKMGVSQSNVANKLRLLNLPNEVQKALMNEKISERHARSLLTLDNNEDQIRYLNRIINERLTVRQLDLAIKDELSERKQEDGDIPKVNINPDIDSIINNAVDINPTVEQPKTVDVFSGLLDNNVKEEEKVEEIQPVEEIKPKNDVPNKFFNFLEDQEVNMNMSNEEEEVKPNAEVFTFDSAIIDSPQNELVEENKQTESTISSLDEEVDTLDFEPSDAIQPTTIEEPVFSLESEPKQEMETPVSIPQDGVQKSVEIEQFVFDDDDDEEENITFTEKKEEPVEPSVEETTEDVVIEPIPVVEEENVVDPVAFFDTLDPEFMNKLKEDAGLDLKTAINDYRDLTNILNRKGFNISIEEADTDGKYHIEIDINKE